MKNKQKEKMDDTAKQSEFMERRYSEITPERSRARAETKLGFFNAINVARTEGKLATKHINQLIETEFRFSYDLAIQQASLSGDLAKKKNFLAYIDADKDLRYQVASLESKARSSIQGLLTELQLGSSIAFNEQQTMIEEMLSQNKISPEQAERIMKDANHANNVNMDLNMDLFNKIIDSHSKLLNQTLKVVLDSLPEGF